MYPRTRLIVLLGCLATQGPNCVLAGDVTFSFSGYVLNDGTGIYSSLTAGTPVSGTLTVNYANAIPGDSSYLAQGQPGFGSMSWYVQAYSKSGGFLPPVTTITAKIGSMAFDTSTPVGGFGNWTYAGNGSFSCHYPPEAAVGQCALLPPESYEVYNAAVLQQSGYEQPLFRADFQISDMTLLQNGTQYTGAHVFDDYGYPLLPPGAPWPNSRPGLLAGGDFMSGTNSPQSQVQYGITSFALVNPPPATVSLTAQPTSQVAGQSVTLTWSAQNAAGCTASGGTNGDGWSGNLSASGSQTMTESSAGSYTYWLSCGAAPATATTTVEATFTPIPPSATLSATPTSEVLGQNITLTWSAQAASGCTASGGATGDGWNGMLATSGSKSLTEKNAGSYTYGISCTGATSTPASAQASADFTAPEGGGGGSIDLAFLLLTSAVTLAAVQRRSIGDS